MIIKNVSWKNVTLTKVVDIFVLQRNSHPSPPLPISLHPSPSLWAIIPKAGGHFDPPWGEMNRALRASTWARSHARVSVHEGLALSLSRRVLCANKLNAFHGWPPSINADSTASIRASACTRLELVRADRDQSRTFRVWILWTAKTATVRVTTIFSLWVFHFYFILLYLETWLSCAWYFGECWSVSVIFTFGENSSLVLI